MSTADMAGRLDHGRTGSAAKSSATRPATGSMTGPMTGKETKAEKAARAAELVARMFSEDDKREKFIPVTLQAIMDRLAQPAAWPAGHTAHVRRFHGYLANWRRQSYSAKLMDLGRAYEPFSPDSDLLVTRKYSELDRASLRAQLVDGMCDLMQQANFTRIEEDQIDLVLTKDSHYGLDLHVDLEAFDVLQIYYRGAIVRQGSRRSIKQLYLRKEEFDIPIFQRLAIVFKLKPEDTRIREIMAKQGLDQDKAERLVKKMRGLVSDQIKPDYVYLKLFKNIPRSDIEMVFPNTKIRFRLFDKIKLGVTASGGLGVGVAGTMTKIAIASNPIALAGALAGLGGIAMRQVVNYSNQRNKYMVKMAQNLYSHALADNRGVMTLLAERAAEEDLKEEVLLYSILAKETVCESEIGAVDKAIERYLARTFGIDVNFDVKDALRRLKEDGLVTQAADGTLVTLPPEAAAARIDKLWDGYLDDMVERATTEGVEFEGAAPESLT